MNSLCACQSTAGASSSYSASSALACTGSVRALHAAPAALRHSTAAVAAYQHKFVWQQAPRAHIVGPARSAASGAQQGGGGSDTAELAIPWRFGFQCAERFLEWDDSSHIKLLRLVLARNQGLSEQQVDEQLQQLANLLPDMVDKLERARADVLLVLLRDLPGLAERLLLLREALPGANVSLLVAQQPQLILAMEVHDLEAKLAALHEQLPGVNVCVLLEQEPRVLAADIEQLLAEVQRLLPRVDAVQYLAANPGTVLSMEVAGLPSTLELNGSGLT